MTSYLIDINVWLALSWRLHPAGPAAHRWLRSLPPTQSRLLFCRIAQLGLLRLLTNQTVMGDDVITIGAALDVYDRWSEDPRVEFAPEPHGLDPALRQTVSEFAKKRATKAIMDAYLAGFAEAAGATLVTFDKGLAGIARRRGAAHLLPSSR